MIYTKSIYTASKKFLSLILALFVLIGLSGCTTDNQTTEIKTVKIGVIAPLSGPAANYGEDTVNAYKFTFEKMKKKGKVKDYNIEFIYEDGKCSGKDATSAAQKLTTVDKVDIILGGVCSAETLAAAKVAQTYKIPILSPASSSPEISKLGEGVRRFYTDINQANVIASYLNNKNDQNIAIIHENTDYAIDLSKIIKTFYKGKVLVEEKINPNEKDLSIVAKKIAKEINNLDDIILIHGGTDSIIIGLVDNLEKEGVLKFLKGKFIGSDTLFSSSILDVVGSKMEGFIATNIPNDRTKYQPEAEKMMNEFNQQYGIKGVDYIILYQEAINLLTDMFDAGNRDAKSISAYLKGIDQENPREGYFGNYYFKGTDAQGLNFVFKKIVNGKPEFIK